MSMNSSLKSYYRMILKNCVSIAGLLLISVCFNTNANGDLIAFRAGDYQTFTVGYEWPAAGNYFRWYKDFNVPSGSPWIVSKLGNMSVFENGSTAGRTARYEIRSGMSSGNGGTLIAGGDAAIHSPVLIAVVPNGTLFDYQITLPSLLTLNPGTYWLTVQPYFLGSSGTFQALTQGVNAVGGPAFDGFVYQSESFNGQTQNFQPLQYGFEAATTIYTVPEPSSSTLVVLSCLICFYRNRKRIVDSTVATGR